MLKVVIGGTTGRVWKRVSLKSRYEPSTLLSLRGQNVVVKVLEGLAVRRGWTEVVLNPEGFQRELGTQTGIYGRESEEGLLLHESPVLTETSRTEQGLEGRLSTGSVYQLSTLTSRYDDL